MSKELNINYFIGTDSSDPLSLFIRVYIMHDGVIIDRIQIGGLGMNSEQESIYVMYKEVLNYFNANDYDSMKFKRVGRYEQKYMDKYCR